MKSIAIFSVLFLLVFTLFGCGNNLELTQQLSEITSIIISPVDPTVTVNSQLQLYAIAVDDSGNSQTVTPSWEVYYSGIGTIDATGLFTASSHAGGGQIRAVYGDFSAYVYLYVTAASLASIQILPSTEVLALGDSVYLEAKGRDAYGNNISISPTWSITGSVGDVDALYYSSYYRAEFTATAAGIGIIKATSGSIEGFATVEVITIDPYDYVSQWNTYAGTQAAFPRGAAIDGSGNVWVTMYSGSYGSYVGTVNKYDAAGNFLMTLEATSSVEGGFEIPNDLAFDSGGNIYIVDSEKDTILKYDSSGNFLLSWDGSDSGFGKFSYPSRIAIDTSDNVYVVDYYANKVQKFTSSGEYLMQWGGYGSDSGEFKYPTGIAIDSNGNIFIADQYNYRIQKFDEDGNYLLSWGSSGSALAGFSSIVGLTVDAADNVYVADYSNNRVYKFDNNGGFITRWGEYGIGNGKFNDPIDVAVGSDDSVYVVDSSNKRIQKFTP